MSILMVIQTAAEFIICAAVVLGICFEEKLIKFERKIFTKLFKSQGEAERKEIYALARKIPEDRRRSPSSNCGKKAPVKKSPSLRVS